MLNTYRLAGADFDALATGLGSPSAIGTLRSAHLSRRLIGLRAVLDAAERAGYKDACPGFDLLSEIQQTDAAAVADILDYPFTGTWIAHCLRQLDRFPAGAGDHLAADLAHLSGLAAAAAIRADRSFSIDVPVRDGAVCLPTLGRLMLGDGTTVTVRRDGHQTMAGDVPLAEGSHWQPLRSCTAHANGLSLTVAIDDVDPYRGPKLPVTARLSDEAMHAWETSVSAAWRILVRHHRGYAAAIAAGLVALVPLVATGANRGVNATSRESFGAAAVSGVPDPLTLAAALLHEFQHSKLNAVLDLVPLCRPDEKRYYAPWRQDPRPVGGLLHGAYAYVGVADFWRVQGTVAATPFPAFAHLEFARWSDRTGRVLGTLLDSGSLTSAGERFALGMRTRLRNWPEAAATEPARLARTVSADHRLGWRLRNARPDSAAIESFAQAWRAGAPEPPAVGWTTTLVDGGRMLGPSDRQDLVQLRLREPSWLARATADTSLDRADVDFVAGRATAASAAYRARIAAEPGSVEAWAGLALALREAGSCPGALLNGPEVVRAVYVRLLELTGRAPDPECLAGWLTPVVPADPLQV